MAKKESAKGKYDSRDSQINEAVSGGDLDRAQKLVRRGKSQEYKSSQARIEKEQEKKEHTSLYEVGNYTGGRNYAGERLKYHVPKRGFSFSDRREGDYEMAKQWNHDGDVAYGAGEMLERGTHWQASSEAQDAYWQVMFSYDQASRYFEKAGKFGKAIKSLQKLKKAVMEKGSEYDKSPEKFEEIDSNISRLEGLESKLRNIRERRLTGKVLPAMASVALLSGIFFLSSNITGNAIVDLTTKTTSFLGAGLLIIGLIAGFFWLKAKKK
jgi:hypothetical protein